MIFFVNPCFPQLFVGKKMAASECVFLLSFTQNFKFEEVGTYGGRCSTYKNSVTCSARAMDGVFLTAESIRSHHTSTTSGKNFATFLDRSWVHLAGYSIADSNEAKRDFGRPALSLMRNSAVQGVSFIYFYLQNRKRFDTHASVFAISPFDQQVMARACLSVLV